MRQVGFTLAELLIALALLGVIATFTIPKVLQAQGQVEYNAKAKEAAAMIAEAYQLYRTKNTVTASTSMDDFTPYINYVRIKTDADVDHRPPLTSIPCSSDANAACYLLHNGGVLWYYRNFHRFTGTGPNDSLVFAFDPDGRYDTKTKSVEFYLWTTGRLSTRGVNDSDPSLDPSWFSW